MQTRVRSLASLSGSRIQHCCELCCRSQTWLGYGIAVAVAVAQAGAMAPVQPLAWEPPCLGYVLGATLKKKDLKKWATSTDIPLSFLFGSTEELVSLSLFHGHTCHIWMFPGQGLNPSHSRNPRHSRSHTRCLNPLCRPQIEPAAPQQPEPLQSVLTHCAIAGTLGPIILTFHVKLVF